MVTNERYSVQDLLDVVYLDKQPPACDQTLQIKVQSAENGIAKGTWTVERAFLNGHGVAMGGFVASAADIMMAYAIASVLQPDQGFSSISLQTTFHRPVVLGRVEVEARVEKLGKSVAYVEATLRQNEKLAASLTSSVLILQP